ncbi:monocyte chemotactic protein 1B-like [Vombatus ursinus]|uniref:monocyte chemotactic protein 1B-like n=1 Tax=Vombatus ursinus TaxID=29139 RepID=UPI000FFD9D5F|nr:monocyte chemotactic protein 1B-like [Vombatus ursinus]XP_027705635.1 monocyte chemotactic protein 1B-like [Vombatus ursinus]XP_027705636.1 monocyte chemotactic protein 1B-like [Vombatus ursinus]
MKVSGVVLSLVLIIAALCCQVHASPDGPSTPTTCCFEFTTRKIPLKLVVSYEITSSRCAKEAVIFVTRRGFQICTNPKEQWVQDIRNHLDKKNAKTQSP